MTAPAIHSYFSTACLHGRHPDCRLTCKWCDAPCGCACHDPEEPAASDDLHVVPLDDLIAHERRDCPCIPTTEPVTRADGTIAWIHVHHSLDGREHHERT